MNLIEEIQSQAIDENVPLATVLRKVKLVAGKLGLKDTAQWVDAELEGYGEDIESYPRYRLVEGRVEAFSPYHGWQPPAGDSAMIDAMSKRQIADSVSSLEDIVRRDDLGTLCLPISQNLQQRILAANPGWTEIHTKVQRSHLVGILSHVRTLALNWALELEESGVSGEGVRFSAAEKEQAQSAHITIENFSGNLHSGNISGTQNRVNLGSVDRSANTANLGSLISRIEEAAAGLEPEVRDAVLSIADELQSRELNSTRFAKSYAKFASLAADHAALLPFLPSLAQFLPG